MLHRPAPGPEVRSYRTAPPVSIRRLFVDDGILSIALFRFAEPALLYMHATDQPRRLFFGLRFACDAVASCGCPVWAGLFRCLFFFSKSGVLPDLTPLSSRDLP